MKPIKFRGKTQSLPAWARDLGIPENTLRSRLKLLGMSIEEAFTRPPDERFKPIKTPALPTVKQPPKLERHKNGQAYVRWMENRTRHFRYFGTHGTREAEAGYARFCAEWVANHGSAMPVAGEAFSVAAVADRFLAWADGYYQKRGKPTSEIHSYRSAISSLNEIYGSSNAAHFGPNHLRTVQSAIEATGVKLRTVNAYVTRIVRVFSWAAGRGLVPSSVADALKHVEGLSPGRSKAEVPEAKTAVADGHVDAVCPHLHPNPVRNEVLATMVKLQVLTGMRPGEVCELRPADVDRSRTPWLYRPASGGKTYHLEKNRKVWLGPAARALIEPWLGVVAADVQVFGFTKRTGGARVAVSVKFLPRTNQGRLQGGGHSAVDPTQVAALESNEHPAEVRRR